MLTIMRKPIFLLLLSAALGVAFGQSGVGISPPRAEFEATPDTQLSAVVLVDNPSGSSALDVAVSLSDALFQPDGSMLYLPPGSHPNSLATWIATNPLQFVLDPSSSREVAYTIQVPPDAPTGTYWTAMFFESQAPGADTSTAGIGLETRVRVGHIIYLDIGEVTRSGEIEGFRYQPPGEDPTSIRVMFRNSGTGLVRVGGHVEVRDEDGSLRETIEVADTPAFPGYSREIAALLSEPLEPGNYLVLAVFDYGEAEIVTGEGWLEIP